MYEKIEALMKARGCSRRELSDATGVPVTTIGSWAAHKSRPSFKWLVPIAHYFGVDVEYFYDESERGSNADIK